MESLENKAMPDKKQWIPLYGTYQLVKDGLDGKPTELDVIDKKVWGLRRNVYRVYQTMGAFGLLGATVSAIAEFYFNK